jgi:GR25 family glycosyltransferase involved in LPS biosynthesis
MIHPIPIVLITSKSIARTNNFLSKWQNIPGISLKIIPGVYLDPKATKTGADDSFFIIEGRKLTVPELGCAEAHFNAREYISTTTSGGIIFEDDARVEDPFAILYSASKFLNENYGQSKLLNLCESKLSNYGFKKLPHFTKLMGYSPLAVSYVLTSEAAKQLNYSNCPTSWVSDWPFSRVKHYISIPSLVRHGDADSGSEIFVNEDGYDIRQKRFKNSKLLNFVNLGRLIKAVKKGYGKKFLYFVYLAPLHWRLDSLKMYLIQTFKC